MTSKLIRDTGEALYGSSWRIELARELAVTDEEFSLLASGATDLPFAMAMDLWRICADRTEALDRLRDRLLVASAPRRRKTSGSNPARH